MGRYVSAAPSNQAEMTTAYVGSGAVKNDDGFLTSYTANDITYTNIAYSEDTGQAAEFGGAYKVVTGWTETNNITNQVQNVTVNYDSTTGEVSSLTIT